MSAKIKNWLIILSFFMSFVICSMAIISVYDIDFKKEPTPNNLLKVDSSYVKDQNTKTGVSVDVNGDGSITLSGKASCDYNLVVTNVTLSKGMYKITGLDHRNIDDFYLYVLYDGTQYIADYHSSSFNIESDEAVVTVGLYWRGGYNFDSIFNKNTVTPYLYKITPIVG